MQAVIRLIELSPQLRELKIKNIGLSEHGLSRVREAVPQDSVFKLVA
jgi:hypothetical protein